MNRDRKLPKIKSVLHVRDHERTPEFEKRYSHLIALAPDAEMWIVADADNSVDMIWLKPFDKPQVYRDGITYSCGVPGSDIDKYFQVLVEEEDKSTISLPQ